MDLSDLITPDAILPALKANSSGSAHHSRFMVTATTSRATASQQGTMPPWMPRAIKPRQPPCVGWECVCVWSW